MVEFARADGRLVRSHGFLRGFLGLVQTSFGSMMRPQVSIRKLPPPWLSGQCLLHVLA
jgi:hypothetical protein